MGVFPGVGFSGVFFGRGDPFHPLGLYIYHIYKYIHTLVVCMFTCFHGGVGHTLLGSHLWKTLSGCFQLDRNKFTCFPHSVEWSSTYIKDLNRVDFFSLGVSQHKSLILTLTASQEFSIQALPSRPEAKEVYVRSCGAKVNFTKVPNRSDFKLSRCST